MSGIDHLVLCGRDLEEMRRCYGTLGFTLTPPARHPFGTGNSLVQLDRCFLELLVVADAREIPEHRPGHFSFAAFNRDYLSRREGFSMLVLQSADARADAGRFRAAGLRTYEPFDFSRKAKLPGGEEATVGFSLAFASDPAMPRAGFFTCQQHAPQHFWKSEYQRHPNGARTILEACIAADDPSRIGSFLSQFTDAPAMPVRGGLKIATGLGDILAVTPDAFADRYGVPAPALPEGPEFLGYTVGIYDDQLVQSLGLNRADGRWIVPAGGSFGTAIAFAPMNRQERPA